MKLCSIRSDGIAGIGALDGTEIRAIFESDASYPGDLNGLIARGPSDLAAAFRKLMKAPTIAPSSVSFRPPIANPGKIICVGLNYHDHTAETNMAQPEYPVFFSRFSDNLIGHGESIQLPRVSSALDYEGELVVIIGRACKHVAKDEALDFVAGYSIFNDASIRDFQTRTHQWTIGKNFDATGAFGPYFVSADELPPGATGLRLETRLNGAVVQSASTADMIHKVVDLISVISDAMTLRPGDIIVSGTPSGVGFARKPPLYMKAGDDVTVDIEGIGRLRNSVVAEA